MTTTVERVYEINAPIEDVWDLLSDASLRATAISVVEEFHQEGDETVWTVSLPIRLVPGRVRVRTRDVERRPPEYVRFEGTARIMTVTGEHDLAPTDEGCRVTNRFEVDGAVPGVETFFRSHIDDEIDNLLALVASELRSGQAG